MADDARATADKQLIHAARTDIVDLFNSVVNADPPVPYDINYADGVGNTALHYAVENVSIHVLDLILDEEVDVDARNRLEGDTPLHLACRISNEEARNYVGMLTLALTQSTNSLRLAHQPTPKTTQGCGPLIPLWAHARSRSWGNSASKC